MLQYNSAKRAYQVVFALNIPILGPHSSYTEFFIRMPNFSEPQDSYKNKGSEP